MADALEKKQTVLETRLADQIDRYAKRVGRLTGQARRNMARYLLDEIRKADKAKTPEASAKALNKAVSSIGQNLTASGYDEVAKELTVMAKETQAAREDYYQELGFDVEGADLERLAMLRKQAVNGVYNGKLSLSTDLKKALVQYEGGKLTHDQLVNRIQAGLGTAQARAYTIANTAVQSADRATSFALGEEIGVEYWQYSGVIIANTREFCKRLLTGRHPMTGEPHPNKYTAEEIAEMSNGQGLPVKENCGGYNCTHIWVPDLESIGQAQAKQAATEKVKPVKLETPERVRVKDYKEGSKLANDAFYGFLDKKTGGKYLNKKQRFSLFDYTSATPDKAESAKAINTKLRAGEIPDGAESLSGAIKRLPAYDGTVYRGMKFNDKSEFEVIKNKLTVVGDTWADKGFMSTSVDRTIMDDYASGLYNIKLIIKSKSGAVINGLSMFKAEQEVLFDKGKNFIIKSHKQTVEYGETVLTVELEDLE